MLGHLGHQSLLVLGGGALAAPDNVSIHVVFNLAMVVAKVTKVTSFWGGGALVTFP